jgi:hypothetical protein
MEQKILFYLPNVMSSLALQTAQNYISDKCSLYAVEILTFQEIFSKVPMDEEEDIQNAYKKLTIMGKELKIPPSNQFVEIGNPGQQLITLIKKNHINVLITTDKRANQLSKVNTQSIAEMGCKIVKI